MIAGSWPLFSSWFVGAESPGWASNRAKVALQLRQGPSAYSDLAVLPDGAILCFYESGKPGETRRGGDWAYARLTVARFSLEWLGVGR
jgi:hypothetical protein